MKSPTILFLVITLFLSTFLFACGSALNSQRETATTNADVAAKQAPVSIPKENESLTQQVSLKNASSSATVAAAADRKIIRNADLTLEVTSPSYAQRQVSSIAEQNGGFVVTSESTQRTGGEPGKRLLDIKLVARVAANQFDNAVSSIEKLSTSIIQRNVSGQDVTEEFIDLEARIRTQKALELQFLEIMKQANKVADALEVQRQIADVRTEIEKLEGRKRFLENHTSLSTIVVNLQAPVPIAVNTSGFGRSVREATSESIDNASAILLFLVRFVIVMLPIFVFVLLPAGLMARYLVRRAKRVRLAQALHVTPTSE
jgi:hypothetical protein